MWHRFSEEAKEAVHDAQWISANNDDVGVSPDDLAFGVLNHEASDAVRIIERLGLDRLELQQLIVQIIESSPGQPGRDARLTVEGKRCIDIAYDEARNLNHDFIGSIHLLLGIVREGTSQSAKLLRSYGISLSKLRDQAKQDGAILEKKVTAAATGSDMLVFSDSFPELVDARNVHKSGTQGDLPDVLTVKLHPDVDAEDAYEVLVAIADFYRACGGAGFRVNWDEELVQMRSHAHV